MQAYRITSEYGAERDTLSLIAEVWKAKDGPYPAQANYLIHDRVEGDVYGIVWGYSKEEALTTAFRIMTMDMVHQVSDPVGEASYYERII